MLVRTSNLKANVGSKPYHETSNISCTKYTNLNVSCLVLQLYLLNPLKPGVRSRMKIELEQRRQAMLQLHESDQQFHCILRRGLYWKFDGKLTVYRFVLVKYKLRTFAYVNPTVSWKNHIPFQMSSNDNFASKYWVFCGINLAWTIWRQHGLELVGNKPL